MDDLGSELDPKRTSALMEVLLALGSQVFVTTTDLRYLPASRSDTACFEVRGGAIVGA
jgi:recombinational DNA repair ATPase RecF